MTVQRISIKLFVEEPAVLDPAAVIPLFHRWIQTGAVPGLLLDVIDYRHVPGGPGVLLAGHEGDYAFDLGDGRPGLLYRHKRAWPGEGLASRLELALSRAVGAALILAADPIWQGWVSFRSDEVEVAFHDRLRTPNRPESWAVLEPALQRFYAALFPEASVQVARASDDPRKPVRLQLHLPGAARLDAWPVRLAQQPVAGGAGGGR